MPGRWMSASLSLVLAAAMGLSACHRGGAGGDSSVQSPSVGPDNAGAPAVPFDVRADSTDLTFFWFDEHGNAHPTNRAEDVPVQSRDHVRVDPPRPDLRAPGWVYIADLRAPRADGRYAVRAIPSEQFANDLASLSGLAQAMAAPSPAMPVAPNAPPSVLAPVGPPLPPAGGGNAAAHVTIYGASWCSACHQAAAWLRSQNIPFIEHDIETEPAAAQDLYARARQQGVPTGSIPIIDVNGRLMVGFNPQMLQQAIRGG